MNAPQQQLAFLALPGCTLTKRTLLIPSEVSDTDLPTVGARVLAVRGCMRWAIGAILHEMLSRRTKTVATGRTLTDESWANDFADLHDIDPKERREYLAMHLFFPATRRTIDLSYEHYREAMMGTHEGGKPLLSQAIDYLILAHSKGWTHTQLRRHIRTSQAQEHPDTTQTQFQGYGAIFDFRRYLLNEAKNPITPERATILLQDIGQETLDFLDHLRTLTASQKAV